MSTDQYSLQREEVGASVKLYQYYNNVLGSYDTTMAR